MKDKDNKKRYVLVMMLFLLVGISIGYAALATTLNINGNTTIEKASWDIHFENLVKTTGSEAATTEASIDGAKTLIEYTVTLAEPGDFYEFTVDMVNNGTIDAMISDVLKQGLTTDQEKYISYTATYSDGVALEEKDYLKSGETQNIKVRVKYRDDINAEELPTENQTLSLKFMVTYIQADESAKDRNKLINVISQEEEGKLLPGDEIAISTEHFYVVSSDENETVMLAKYNLLVGGVYDYNLGKVSKTFTELDEGYGLQNELAKGFDRNLTEWVATLAFSSKFYWEGKVGIDLTYPPVEDEKSYPYVYDSNSNLYNYVESYKAELQKLGVSIQEARLLSYQEATSLGWDSEYRVCENVPEKTKFICLTTFWLGNAGQQITKENSSLHENPALSVVSSDFYNISYDDNKYSGVRPVIVVKTSDIL